MQSEDRIKEEIFLDDIQEIANMIGDENEIEIDTNLFWRLLVINCPKKMFDY